MTIGLICAIPQELEHLRVRLDDVKTVAVAQLRFDEGTLDGHRVVLVGAGMGKVNAAIVTTLLAGQFGCRAIVFSGVAGGLDPALHIGDVVIADRVVQHDAGLIENEVLQRYQAGHVPFINPTEALGFSTNHDLLSRVRQHLEHATVASLPRAAGGRDRPPRIVYGTVLTGDQFLHCETTRERLAQETGGQAIEMEGGAIAQVCAVFGIPWLVIRALSDLAGRDSSIDFAAFAEGVAAVSADIVRQILPVL
jgi:adenosylhomocysteine nucleosidase